MRSQDFDGVKVVQPTRGEGKDTSHDRADASQGDASPDQEVS